MGLCLRFAFKPGDTARFLLRSDIVHILQLKLNFGSARELPVQLALALPVTYVKPRCMSRTQVRELPVEVGFDDMTVDLENYVANRQSRALRSAAGID